MEHTVTTLNRPDQDFDLKLRPARFEDFTGQEKIKERLELFVEAAKARDDVLDHALLSGPPGLGKTTLAGIIAEAMGANMKCTSGPVIDKPGDLAGLLTSIERGDVLFIDEIHRMQKTVEEYLYSAMEDFVIDIVIDQGPNARSVRLNIEPFTLIGATTRAGLLTAPLRGRFGITGRLDYYNKEEIGLIITRNASKLNVVLGDGAVVEIAGRCRGTPRIANRLLRRLRDFAEVEGSGTVTEEIARDALTRLEIDDRGLDDMDKRLLGAIVHKYRGGPVGLSTLAVTVGEDPGTIEELYEPYLIQQGLLERTPRGRMATTEAFRVLGVSFLGGPGGTEQPKLL